MDKMKERFDTLSDAIIAIAITILVLEIEAPTTTAELGSFFRYILLFIISFTIIVNIWYKRTKVMNVVREVNIEILTLDLIAHLGICLIPLFNKLMFNFDNQSLAVLLYGLLNFAITSLYNIINIRLVGYGLLDDSISISDDLHIRMRHWYYRMSVVSAVTIVVAYLFPRFGIVLYTILPITEFFRRYQMGRYLAKNNKRAPKVFEIYDRKYSREELLQKRKTKGKE